MMLRFSGAQDPFQGEEDLMELSTDQDKKYGVDEDIDIDLDLSGQSSFDHEDDLMIDDGNSVTGQYTFDASEMPDNKDDDMVDDGQTPQPLDHDLIDVSEEYMGESTGNIYFDDEALEDADDGVMHHHGFIDSNLQQQEHSITKDGSGNADGNAINLTSTMTAQASEATIPSSVYGVYTREDNDSLSQLAGQDQAFPDSHTGFTQGPETEVSNEVAESQGGVSQHQNQSVETLHTEIHGTSEEQGAGQGHFIPLTLHQDLHEGGGSPPQDHIQGEEITHKIPATHEAGDHSQDTVNTTTGNDVDDEPSEHMDPDKITKVSDSGDHDDSDQPHQLHEQALYIEDQEFQFGTPNPQYTLDDHDEEQEHPIRTGDLPNELLDRDHDKASIHSHTHVHPVIVVYQDNRILLFPPREQDDEHSQTFFLEDESLVNENINSLLGACRVVLAESISVSDELEIKISSLGLEIGETTIESSTTSLAEIIDVFLQLHANDGQDNPDPLEINLITKPRFSHRLEYLYGVIADGNGFSQFAYHREEQDGNDGDHYDERINAENPNPDLNEPADNNTPNTNTDIQTHEKGLTNEPVLATGSEDHVDFTVGNKLEPTGAGGDRDDRDVQRVETQTSEAQKGEKRVEEVSESQEHHADSVDESQHLVDSEGLHGNDDFGEHGSFDEDEFDDGFEERNEHPAQPELDQQRVSSPNKAVSSQDAELAENDPTVYVDEQRYTEPDQHGSHGATVKESSAASSTIRGDDSEGATDQDKDSIRNGNVSKTDSDRPSVISGGEVGEHISHPADAGAFHGEENDDDDEDGGFDFIDDEDELTSVHAFGEPDSNIAKPHLEAAERVDDPAQMAVSAQNVDPQDNLSTFDDDEITYDDEDDEAAVDNPATSEQFGSGSNVSEPSATSPGSLKRVRSVEEGGIASAETSSDSKRPRYHPD